MGVHYNHKLVAVLFATSVMALPNLAQAQSKLSITDFVGTINWTQTDGDIRVDVVNGDADVTVRNKGNSGVQVFGEYDKLRHIQCKGSKDNRKLSVTRKINYKTLDEYPVLNITLPADAEVFIDNSVPFIYGTPNVKSFEASPRGCGEIEVGDVTELLDVTIGGSNDFVAGNIGQANIRLSGSSDLTVENIGDLDAQLSGSSDLKGQNVQSLKASQSGSSGLQLGDVNAPAKLKTSGSSDSRIGVINGGFDYHGSGSSDVVVASVDGPVLIDVSGATDVDINDGKAEFMEVRASGASDVTFKGAALGLDARASGAADISVYEVTGALKKSRSGAASINIKRYKDAYSED